MPRFAANLTMMYNEHPFLERFAAAAADDFDGVEILFPYAEPAAEIRARLDDYQLEQALFNLPPGDWENGERGLASLPGREDDFRRALDTALAYAEVLGNKRLHVMAGRIADEVISHIVGLVGSNVRVTLEIEAEIPGGAPDNVVRTVTENGRTLKFTSQGFEKE